MITNKFALRLILGILLLIVSVVQIVRGSYPYGALYGVVGILFLVFALKSRNK